MADTVKPEAAIFDADGTLCDVRGIRHYVEGGNRNFDAFHKASAFCPPNHDVVEAVFQQQALGRKIVVATGRSMKYGLLTFRWLESNGIPVDAMFMRADGDFRKDVEVKMDILAEIREEYTPVCAWDDNPSIINLWESEGIPTTVVPGWTG